MSKRDSDGAATEGEGNSRDDGLYPKPKREKGSKEKGEINYVKCCLRDKQEEDGELTIGFRC